jgi:alpha-2-macroglobulin
MSRKFLYFLILAFFFIGSFSIFLNHNSKKNKQAFLQTSTNQNNQAVLGNNNYQYPQIYLYGGNNSEYSSGGLITLASTDEPAVVIGGYQLSGEAEIAMYVANKEMVLDYLTHDKDNKQIKKAPDVNTLPYVTTVKQTINTNTYQGSKVILPFADKGIWYLKVKLGATNVDAFVVRSDIGVLAKNGDSEIIFWGQNFSSKRSIESGNLKLFNLQDSQKELQNVQFDSDGIAKTRITNEADIALAEQDDNVAIVPLNLAYLNTGYSYTSFQAKTLSTRYFIFTDRPLYKPGDTVNFKAILRDEDDVRYSIPSGTVLAKIYNGYYYEGTKQQADFEKSYPISSNGTISGSYQLPENIKVGFYTLSLSIPNKVANTNYWGGDYFSSTATFDVQYFQKPEFSIDVTSPNIELIAQDKSSFKISGNYFSGQPLVGQEVKYKVTASDFYEYQYLNDQETYSQNLSDEYRYGYWGGSNTVTEGTSVLDKKGEAQINLETKMSFNNGKNQVFSIEATLNDGSQTPAFSRKNLLVFAGEYGIYQKDYSYGVTVNNPLTLPLVLKAYRDKVNVSNLSLSAKIHIINWVQYQESDKKYPSYRKEESDLASINTKTDSGGNAVLTFTPSKIGSYQITVEGQDKRGNLISKIFYYYVSDKNQPFYWDANAQDITITADKKEYSPEDTARLDIYSVIPDRDVFLSLERGRVNRFQIVHLDGKTAVVDMPLEKTDMPNIFAQVSSFSASSLDMQTVDLQVRADSQNIVVKITPDNKTYGPGETVNVNLQTTDIKGNPVSSEIALWAVDKAIYELSEDRLGNIFDKFWSWRWNSTVDSHSLRGITVQGGAEAGGCFAAGTQVLMADNKTKNIEDIKTGDYVLTRTETNSQLVKAKVLKTSKAEENGYLIINGNLKLTANHILWVNKSWRTAGDIQIGDSLLDNQDREVKVSSIEWQAGKFSVYNLEIENFHTYFADGIWVHNQKGGARNVLKDTAYWNPVINTDSEGRAKISFKLPDNLTTWTLVAVASTLDTKVGQTTGEILVTKEVIVRPILPNILRIGDEIVLSALVQNSTPQEHQYEVDLKFDSGSVEQSVFTSGSIKENETSQFYWKVKPNKENDKAQITITAKAKDNDKLVDSLTREIPVIPFGFFEKSAETGIGDKSYSLSLAPDSSREKTTINLSLSPTILGTLPAAMNYLIEYPYGCVEQTTSRFIPALIAKQNPTLFGDALKANDLDKIINKSIVRLQSLQRSDGSWSWWESGQENAFVTAYVVDSLVGAKNLGYEVKEETLSLAKSFLQRTTYYTSNGETNKTYATDELIPRYYGLTLLGAKDLVKEIKDFDNLSPDLLSYAVMTNYLNGYTEPETNGLNKLISLAKTEGDTLYWESTNKINFASKDAATALAIKAIVMAKGDRDIAVKGANFLTRNRKYDYWSNTYATAQVIGALVELSKTGNEVAPNYSYVLNLDGKQIAQGTVNSVKQVIPAISIKAEDLNNNGSNLSITKTGEGQLYSVLVVNEFRTDRNIKAENKGLSIKREYVNEKGANYSLGVGDTVYVVLTVSGPEAEEYYGVISDELPTGLVPINEYFKNEQYGANADEANYYYNLVERDITQNGIVMSPYHLAPGEKSYIYKARVVSEGTFIVPPATVALMYAPEISARTGAQTLKINKESEVLGKGNPMSNLLRNTLLIIWIILLFFLGMAIFIIRKIRNKRMNQKNSEPVNPVNPETPTL